MRSVLFLGLLFGFELHAELADRAYQISEVLSEVEDQLHPVEREVIRRNLRRVELVLDIDENRSPSLPRLLCLSNGDRGSFERFGVYHDGKMIGGYTSATKCDTIVTQSRLGLICLSNGDTGSFERFTPNHYVKNQNLGASTSLQTCLDLVAKATRHFMCVSNGDTGSFQRFRLLDRSRNTTIGGWTSLENCMKSLPRD